MSKYIHISSPAPFLDTFTGAVAAYSMRKLRTSYGGDCIRVRRSSDNAESDIGFVNSLIDYASMQSFVGANDGFVTTWYDQSTNANNATQVTSTLQPRIISGGTVEYINGVPAVLFAQIGATYRFLSANSVAASFSGTDLPCTALAVYKARILKTNEIMGFANAGAVLPFYSPFLETSATQYGSGRRDNGGGIKYPTFGTTNLNQKLIDGYFTGTTQTVYVNGGMVLNAGDLNVGAMTVNTFSLGALNRFGGAINLADIFLQESIIYAADNSANRTGMQTNINSFFKIY